MCFYGVSCLNYNLCFNPNKNQTMKILIPLLTASSLAFAQIPGPEPMEVDGMIESVSKEMIVIENDGQNMDFPVSPQTMLSFSEKYQELDMDDYARMTGKEVMIHVGTGPDGLGPIHHIDIIHEGDDHDHGQIPGEEPPYTGGPAPLPGDEPPYTGGPAPIAGGPAPIPGDEPPYTGDPAPIAGVPAPLPGDEPPYTGDPAPIPGGEPPYTGDPAPIAGGPAPLPGDEPPYTGDPAPIPGGEPPYSDGPMPGDEHADHVEIHGRVVSATDGMVIISTPEGDDTFVVDAGTDVNFPPENIMEIEASDFPHMTGHEAHLVIVDGMVGHMHIHAGEHGGHDQDPDGFPPQ